MKLNKAKYRGKIKNKISKQQIKRVIDEYRLIRKNKIQYINEYEKTKFNK